ncbi:MAG: TonB family protein [Candidatus Accumulibacter sp.]|nr:TonB family protein [Accumulibacter sp.]
MISPPRRALLLALAVSLTAHAVLLFGVVPTHPPRLPALAAAIEVVALGRTSSPEAPAAEAVIEAAGKSPSGNPSELIAVESVPPPRVDPPSPVRAAGSNRRKTAPVPSRTKNLLARRGDPTVATTSSPPASASEPEELAEPASAGIASASGGADEETGEATARGPGVSSVPATAREGHQVGGGELGRYRSALAANARRLKRYPPLARERGWEGSVEVSLDFRRSAEPVFSLLASSGKEILDEQALETFRQAVRRTELPESLRGRDFQIRQEFVFSLEDER